MVKYEVTQEVYPETSNTQIQPMLDDGWEPWHLERLSMSPGCIIWFKRPILQSLVDTVAEMKKISPTGNETSSSIGFIKISLNKEWITLEKLKPGSLFETVNGIRAVKSEYYYDVGDGQCLCVLLGSGEYAHFPGTNKVLVRQLHLREE